jgi:3-hydroxyisobutyrate dehydrogenase-like beta-hydroxyacid dehydrogenase
MAQTIAIIAPGEMGSAVGGMFSRRGARVLTVLDGRSKHSVQRAERNGFLAVDDDAALVAQADFVFSILPPGEAETLAQRLQPTLALAGHKPIYVDCNAVAPDTAKWIGDIIASTGCRFVDAGIIGAPPKDGAESTKIYLCGDAAKDVTALAQYGLDLRVIDGPIGAASALKMSYAGLTKGFTALGAAMMLAASHSGAADVLRRELAESRPDFLLYLARQVPIMFPKAYRWVAEMEEIAAFSEDAPSAEIYNGMARLYERLAESMASRSDDDEIATLAQFCEASQRERKIT